MTDTSEKLKFVLDNKIVEIDFSEHQDFKPSVTVLNYLRGLENHKGVKEGCAEGDCGACTVVVAEKETDGRLRYKAVDSCLMFLPALHGKQLITVENLAIHKEGKTFLHPVQQAMIDCNGSQCGFCTPGMVMSMFALYKNHRNPSRETIQNALTGNLCRCTGYNTILEAAGKVCSSEETDHFSEEEPQIISLLDRINNPHLELTSDGQVYFRPVTLEKLFEILENKPDIILVNGATDIALRQTKKHEDFHALADISGISSLKYCENKDGRLVFGSGVSMEDFRKKVTDFIPALYDLLSVFGSLQIRNVATLGGNIGSASPIGDTLPVLFALQAEVMLKSRTTERIVSIEDFITGYRKTALLQGEIITGVIIRIPPAHAFLRCYKISKRKTLDISTVSAAFYLEKNKEGHVQEIILAFGGMAAMTVRARQAEKFLNGNLWTEATIKEAAALLEKEFSPISDARAGAGFRRIVAGNLLLKFYEEVK